MVGLGYFVDCGLSVCLSLIHLSVNPIHNKVVQSRRSIRHDLYSFTEHGLVHPVLQSAVSNSEIESYKYFML